MKKLLLLALTFLLAMNTSHGQKNRKVSKAERANMTPEQRIARDNDRVNSKNKKHKKEDTVKDKVKRAKRQDRANRRVRKPKK
jgi:hypothetical protein